MNRPGAGDLRGRRVLIVAMGLLAAAPLAAQQPRIADNSFLIEEAYNQEPGVVQHISNLQAAGPRHRDLAYAFTQEWPLGGMRHQLSYTVPVLFAEGAGAGFGDVLINYRYQLAEGRVSVSPRASLVLPSGSWIKQNGYGSPGIQLNMPVSLRLSRQVVTHWNAGGTLLPAARNPAGGRKALVQGSAGASIIGPIMMPVNLMLEALVVYQQALDAGGAVVHATDVVFNPGLRVALDVGRLQIVPGFSVPLHLRGARDADLFFYLSFEHPFRSVDAR